MSVRAVFFDLYGTLLDVTGLRTAVAREGVPDADGFVAEWRRKQIEYAFCVTIGHLWHDFDVLTTRSLDYVCANRSVDVGATARARMVEAWRELPAYPDAAPALRRLRDRDMQTLVLTNGVRESAFEALTYADLRPLITDVLSVETVRSYKPDRRVYELATERFSCEPGDLFFVSTNGWDAAGAATFGFRTAWCNRYGAAAETIGKAPTTVLSSLDELDAFVGA